MIRLFQSFVSRNCLFSVNADRLVCAVLVLATLLWGCEKKTEQDEIEQIITSVQEVAEKKEIKKILSHVSKAYRDPQGNDYAGIKDLLIVYFFRHQKLSIFITNIEVVVSGASARSTFQAVLSGRSKLDSAGDILPQALGAYRFDVAFNKEAGEWKVISAKWERFQL